MTLDQATTNSVNTVYAQLISEVGPERVKDMLEELGFAPKYGEEEIKPYCSNALGGALDVTPLEQARAYAAHGERGHVAERDAGPLHHGQRRQLRDGVRRAQGRLRGRVRRSEPTSGRSANDANVLTESLTHVVESGTATVANIGRPVAGKTGTSQENRDVWFAGYTTELTTAVWVGYPPGPGPGREEGHGRRRPGADAILRHPR